MIILHGAIALVVLAIVAGVLLVGKAVDIVGWARRKKTGQPKPNPYGTLTAAKSSNGLEPEPEDSEGNQWG